MTRLYKRRVQIDRQLNQSEKKNLRVMTQSVRPWLAFVRSFCSSVERTKTITWSDAKGRARVGTAKGEGEGEGEGEHDEPLVEMGSEIQGALRESAPRPPTCGASRRLELYYRPRRAVPLPVPAKPSSQLARAGAEACRCLSPIASTGRFEIPA
jgi:hypothetical protein